MKEEAYASDSDMAYNFTHRLNLHRPIIKGIYRIGGRMRKDYRETRFPSNLVNVRIQANSSYQLKRVLEAVEQEKGFTLMSKSDVQTNRTAGPRLRQFITFKDDKAEKRVGQKRKKSYKSYTEIRKHIL